MRRFICVVFVFEAILLNAGMRASDRRDASGRVNWRHAALSLMAVLVAHAAPSTAAMAQQSDSSASGTTQQKPWEKASQFCSIRGPNPAQ
jgi:hypothetical protein